MGAELTSEFLNRIKEEGRSSPAGQYWHDFYKLLLRHHTNPSEPGPPVPLILAASIESNASKHGRLSDQLDWAIDHGCINEALVFMSRPETDGKWNVGPLKDRYKAADWSDLE